MSSLPAEIAQEAQLIERPSVPSFLNFPEEVLKLIMHNLVDSWHPHVVTVESVHSYIAYADALMFCTLHESLYYSLRSSVHSACVRSDFPGSYLLARLFGSFFRHLSICRHYGSTDLEFVRSLVEQKSELVSLSLDTIPSAVIENVKLIVDASLHTLRSLHLEGQGYQSDGRVIVQALAGAMKHVTTLDIRSSNFTHADIVQLVEATEGNLLNLTICLHSYDVKFFQTTDVTLARIAQLCPALQVFRTQHEAYTADGLRDFAVAVGSSLRGLSCQSSFNNGVPLRKSHICDIAASCPSLRHFDIGLLDSRNIENLGAISALAPRLTSLRVECNKMDFPPAEVPGFLRMFENLRELRLPYRVTRESISQICKTVGPRLHLLELDCSREKFLCTTFMEVARCTNLRMLHIVGDACDMHCTGPGCGAVDVLLKAIGSNLRRLFLRFYFGNAELRRFEYVDRYDYSYHVTGNAVCNAVWMYCKDLEFLQLKGVHSPLGNDVEQYRSLFRALKIRMPGLRLYVEARDNPLWSDKAWDFGCVEFGSAPHSPHYYYYHD